jgi:hypothetical protein
MNNKELLDNLTKINYMHSNQAYQIAILNKLDIIINLIQHNAPAENLTKKNKKNSSKEIKNKNIPLD